MSKARSAPVALSIVGSGRAGNSIAAAARRAGIEVRVVGRSTDPGELSGTCLLLCVPDDAIARVAREIGEGEARPKLIGHVSGATSLDPLLAARAPEGCFSLHPLQTLPDGEVDLTGAPAAVAGSTDSARSLASGLAEALGMNPFAVDEADRATYHAAASIASNFLVTLEQSAAELLGDIGVESPREVLAPLVRRSLENWIRDGASALTGPIARGDDSTVERHREALLRSEPALLPLYDAMTERTRSVAATGKQHAGDRETKQKAEVGG